MVPVSSRTARRIMNGSSIASTAARNISSAATSSPRVDPAPRVSRGETLWLLVSAGEGSGVDVNRLLLLRRLPGAPRRSLAATPDAVARTR